MTLSAGTRLGPYEILAPLGAGGMGEVYRARDTRLAREVAIKVLPEALAADQERLRRFEKEAKSASALNHPSIVTIYDIGSESGVSYIAMELVEGVTLRELMLSGPLQIKKLLQISPQIAEGLARAHEAGIVHRDLKPENVMVKKDGLVKILDFGLAKLTSTMSGSGEGSNLPTMTGTTPGVVVGTVGYMSPEQASGAAVDFRSDQFSFGSVLYEMATGKRAFQKKTAIDTLGAILNEEPEPIAAISPQTPAPLRWIAERCLAKEPLDRYASTDDLARDLVGLKEHLSDATLTEVVGVVGATPRRRAPRAAIVASLLSIAVGLLAGRLLWRSRAAASPRFQQVTFQKASIETAAFAPDGQTIVYGALRSDGRLELYQTRPGSRGSRSLGIFDATVASISVSGDMALIQESDTGADSLAVAPLGGGEPRPLLDDVAWADWSPDGKTLAISRGQNLRARLEFPIGNVLHENVGGRLRVSPGGDRVAFREGARLGIVDRQKHATFLVEDPHEFGWSPDGTELWFTRIHGGSTHLYGITLSGRERLLASLPGAFTLSDVSRSGRVLFERGFEQLRVVGRFPGDEREHGYNWLDATVTHDLSADGKTLLFMEKEPGWRDAMSYVRKTDGSAAVPLSEGFCMALSPDTKWAICRSELLAPSLKLVSTSGETRSLPNGGLQFKIMATPSWLPDGKAIVFPANAPGRPTRIYFQAVDGKAPVPVTDEGVDAVFLGHAVSPDGKFVVGLHDGTAALYPLEVKGGPAVPIGGIAAGDLPIQWSDDGKALYVRRDDAPGKIWRIELATGQKRLIQSIQPTEPWRGPGRGQLLTVAITPDGRSYVATSQGGLADLFVLDGVK